MTPIFCVSYPRSGCRYLADSLKQTLGERHQWFDQYSTRFDPAIHNHRKTHDFNLHDKPDPGWETIIQIRNPWDAIASWFDLNVSRGSQNNNAQELYRWAEPAAIYWNRFVLRWITNENMWCVVRHEKLVSDPAGVVRFVCGVMGFVDVTPRPLPVRRPSSFKAHRFYSKRIQNRITDICNQGLLRTGYRP